MEIAITGATGLIGTALAASLRADGHQVRAVSRSTGPGSTIAWDPSAGTIDAAALEGLDAVVHLAGEPIAARPWTASQRGKIVDSRVQGTRLLAGTLAALERPPAVLVSGSAIGAYGDRGDEELTEASPRGTGFLADVCARWEAAADVAAQAGIRVAHIRTGIVLAAHGGALGAQLPIFKLGLGGKAGRGDQWLPWISLADEVAAIRFTIDQPALAGAVNLVGPNPVTSAAFTRALGRAVHRPTLLTIPGFVRHLPGGVGPLLDSLLFSSARVLPDVLTAAGFTFADTDIDATLAEIVGAR